SLLRAEVPFSFSMNGREFRPGAYELQTESRPVQLILRNLETYRSEVTLYASEALPRNTANGKSKLVFQVHRWRGHPRRRPGFEERRPLAASSAEDPQRRPDG